MFAMPYDGITFPLNGGYYYINLELITSSTAVLERYSDFLFIVPAPMIALDIFPEIQTTGMANLFTFSFQVAVDVPEYAAGGRI